MAWTAPRLWVTGEVVTAALGNTHWRANLRYLKGLDGIPPTIESGLIIDNTGGDEYFLLPLLATAECGSVLDAEGKVAHDEATHRIKFHDGTAIRSIVSTADVDDAPVNGATTDPISSNYMYDHVAAADPHAGYLLESLADAQADILYATGDNAWTKLAKGTASQFLKMNSGATAPEWGTTLSAFKLLSHTRALDAASGDVEYTGYGFQPKAIIILANAVTSASSWGLGDTALAEMCIWSETATPTRGASTTEIVFSRATAGNSQSAVLKTLDADGFTLTWTKAGTGAPNTITLMVLACG